MLFSKWYIKLMLNGINKTGDIYKFCLTNPKICSKNKELICKKLLISNGYKNFLTKNYYSIFKELLNINKHASKHTRDNFIDDLDDFRDIKMTQTLWNYCKVYGSIGLKHFVNINKPDWIIDYRYEDIIERDIYTTNSNKIITLNNCENVEIYSGIYGENVVIYSGIYGENGEIYNENNVIYGEIYSGICCEYSN